MNKFRNAVCGAMLVGLLVACGQDPGSVGALGSANSAAGDGLDATSSAGGQAAGGAAPMSPRGPGQSFADLPDHGDLVGYPQAPVVRRAGPYTWHRADVSEAHALRAMVEGVLDITTPSGERLRFRYDRHIEHDSGDWTWIGHVVGGGLAQDAILTFGADAVFGSIAQPGKAPLELTVQDGASWLVETDAAALARQSRESGRHERPDFRVPPELPAPDGLSARASAAPIAGAAAAATTVVDVLVGYTDGFAAAWTTNLGNRSPIMTRLNFLVDVTNESYVNSQVDARVRMVHTMQVAYTDHNDNSDALTALTGSDGSSTPDLAAVDPALQALHAARNQYGADLVSLVRDFQHPEAVSCGVAWLLGGGQNQVHAGYHVYGMSIVSDGNDSSYRCDEVTFAHELGHNMGLAHDTETAKGEDGVLDDPEDFGRYPYSFGYKTGPGTGDFYTVMAYGDSGQIGYRVFSNPAVSICGGFPCGVDGQADNARTLRQMIPIIATFRGQVVPSEERRARSDFDGDGRSDILWRNFVDGQGVIWGGGSPGAPQGVATVPDLQWTVVGLGDFDGDGAHDVLWRNVASGLNIIWRSGNAATPQNVATVPNVLWKVAGVGDFNGDGADDVLWRNAQTGENVIWRSGNAATPQAVPTVPDLSWKVAGVGDFNGDGSDDLLWRNFTSGENVIWRSASAGAGQAVATVPSQLWQVAGIGDFNGDGTDDLLWRNASTGENTIWLSGNAATSQAVSTVPDLQWKVASVGDFDGDGADDILWRNGFDGQNVIWKSGNSAAGLPVPTVHDTSWDVVD